LKSQVKALVIAAALSCTSKALSLRISRIGGGIYLGVDSYEVWGMEVKGRDNLQTITPPENLQR
jgi:hypothetical protein